MIEGADPRQAELRWDAEEGAWFVHGGPAPGRTLRNGEPVGSSRLVDGDELEIAGVRIRYADGRLAERVTSARLRVSVRGVSATAGGMQSAVGVPSTKPTLGLKSFISVRLFHQSTAVSAAFLMRL